ncbi:MAG: universal stress protein [Actinomycetota bacterium]|nr:MAG: UspA domain-containing protein [Acidimicrobiaceae bacterium]
MAADIIVGIGPDGSGDHAAEHAVTLARALGSTVVLVFGYDLSTLGPRGGPLEEQLEAVADEVSTAVRERLIRANPDVAIDVELVRDRAVDSLMRAAEARGASMIVVGHGGAGPLRAALLGSTTYEIIHRSTIPVLVVPDPEESADA